MMDESTRLPALVCGLKSKEKLPSKRLFRPLLREKSHFPTLGIGRPIEFGTGFLKGGRPSSNRYEAQTPAQKPEHCSSCPAYRTFLGLKLVFSPFHPKKKGLGCRFSSSSSWGNIVNSRFVSSRRRPDPLHRATPSFMPSLWKLRKD